MAFAVSILHGQEVAVSVRECFELASGVGDSTGAGALKGGTSHSNSGSLLVIGGVGIAVQAEVVLLAVREEQTGVTVAVCEGDLVHGTEVLRPRGLLGIAQAGTSVCVVDPAAVVRGDGVDAVPDDNNAGAVVAGDAAGGGGDRKKSEREEHGHL